MLPDLGIGGILAFKYDDLTLLKALEVSSLHDDVEEWRYSGMVELRLVEFLSLLLLLLLGLKANTRDGNGYYAVQKVYPQVSWWANR